MRKRSEIGKAKETAQPAPVAAPKPTGEKVTCPKCGLDQPGGGSECLACGEKFAAPKAAPAPVKIEERPTKPLSNEQTEQENIGKLAYDLKARDLDITLAQLSSIAASERRTLRAWLDAKSSDATPAVRMILEHFKVSTPIPQIGSTDHEIFAKDGPLVSDHRLPQRMAAEKALVDDEGEEVTYVFGKEMYRVTEFCTFDIGPYSATSKIRAGENRAIAMNRLRRELESMAEVDRREKRDKYIATLLGIKPALKAASDSIKE